MAALVFIVQVPLPTRAVVAFLDEVDESVVQPEIDAHVGIGLEELCDDEGNALVYYTATPALLTVAARFLKDNDITCTVEDSEGLSSLQDQLAERKKRKNKIRDISFLSKEAEA